jgi:hypothetical protein
MVSLLAVLLARAVQVPMLDSSEDSVVASLSQFEKRIKGVNSW